MAFNVCQLLILLGLFQGIVCIVVLMSFSSIKSKSNLYLSLLILSFIGNIGQYWLKDVGIIDYNTMQLIFLPWQMLVAPLFYLYVHSLKIFNQFPYRKWVLFLPLAIVLSLHFVVKVLIISQGLKDWLRPEWVSTFYLSEEIVSLAYCLLVAVLIYRLIAREKRRPNYNGFGINNGIVTWIHAMLRMGFILAIIWMVSLYVVNQNNNFRHYYLLWIVMVVVLNVLGIAGIYYTWKGGGFSVVDLSKSGRKKDTLDGISSTKMQISTPQKYMDDDFLSSIFQLSSQLASANSIPKLQEITKTWFEKQLDINEVKFKSYKSTLQGDELDSDKLAILYNSTGLTKEFIVLNNKTFNQSHLYYLNLVAKALGVHVGRIYNNEKDTKLDQSNRVYQKLLKYFEEDEMYANPDMDLNFLAGKLDVSAGYLSKVINNISSKSFNDFINDYRVEKVKSLMSNQDYAHYNIVGYGLEAGFNSKSTFYKAFQNKEGMSPGKYLETIKG